MGTVRGEVRGKTKREIVEKWKKAKKKYGMMLVFMPNSEKEAAAEAVKEESGEYVLKFTFTS